MNNIKILQTKISATFPIEKTYLYQDKKGILWIKINTKPEEYMTQWALRNGVLSKKPCRLGYTLSSTRKSISETAWSNPRQKLMGSDNTRYLYT